VGFSTDSEGRIILKLLRNVLRSRLSLLAALLTIFAAAFAGNQPAALASCPDFGNVRYYSDATYTTQVGYCYHACCQTWTCTGQLTQYSIARMRVCDYN
jgi:hypothetical protein